MQPTNERDTMTNLECYTMNENETAHANVFGARIVRMRTENAEDVFPGYLVDWTPRSYEIQED